MNIAERIDQLLLMRGINRNQLSKGANIPYTTIDGIFKKSCDNIKLSTLIKLADFFDVTLDYLVGRNMEDPDEQLRQSFEQFLEWRCKYGKN